jgi:hypothetical protein
VITSVERTATMPLSDFFIGDEATARKVDTMLPPGHPDRIDMKGIQQVEMSQLQCVLEGREWQEDILDDYEMVVEESDEGPWVVRVPAPLVAELCDLRGPKLEAAAAAWAATEELQDWDPAEVHEALNDLVKLAKRAQAAGKSLFMWISL